MKATKKTDKQQSQEIDHNHTTKPHEYFKKKYVRTFNTNSKKQLKTKKR